MLSHTAGHDTRRKAANDLLAFADRGPDVGRMSKIKSLTLSDLMQLRDQLTTLEKTIPGTATQVPEDADITSG